MLVFTTVGTTQFDPLVVAVSSNEAQQALYDRGFRRLRVQTGKGHARPIAGTGVLEVEWFDFKAGLGEDMEAADLIISHAGAGSVLEALRRKKPLIIVVNCALMDNHQVIVFVHPFL